MLLRYPVSDGNTVNLISAYAPTLNSAHEIKEVFYPQLEESIRKIPKAKRLIILVTSMLEWGRIRIFGLVS